jgi:hypothetical protein
MSADNLQQLKSRHPEGLDLISGDGGIDCTANPEEQEMMNAHLHYCEAVASLLCLKKGEQCATEPRPCGYISYCHGNGEPLISRPGFHKNSERRRLYSQGVHAL